jgi:hypothetical protein
MLMTQGKTPPCKVDAFAHQHLVPQELTSFDKAVQETPCNVHVVVAHEYQRSPLSAPVEEGKKL